MQYSERYLLLCVTFVCIILFPTFLGSCHQLECQTLLDTVVFSFPLSPTHQDNESHQLGVGALPALACDDVPLLRGTDDDVAFAQELQFHQPTPSSF